jgi:hypothetical protein
MEKYTRYNNITGWLIFIIAVFVYLSTIEPTSSLWDCGEFIASAYKLQVGHPPGAPFFMIISRVFSLFAGSDTSKAAMMINSLSALASAFTILFLFWTITHLAKKIVISDNNYTMPKIIAVIGSGLVGSLAYTFSDTFWFSAVEAEVYASSSLFTALVFWAILKWENVADEKYANRWLVLIAYLMGLSIGVHLLNLLTIPAIVLVYYFKKYKVTRAGVIMAVAISFLILIFIQYGIIQRIVEFASYHEVLCVNKFGMPYNSGVIIFLGLLLVFIISGITATRSEGTKSEVLYLISFTALNLAIWTFTIGLIISIIFIILYFITKKDLVKTLVIGYLGIIPGLLVWNIFLQEKEKNVLRKKFNHFYSMVITCFTVIIIGYSSYATIVIRSLANPPMDENNPENVFSLLSYLNREQYGERPLIRGNYFNAPIISYTEADPSYIQYNGRYKKHTYRTDYEYDKKFTTLFPRMYSNDDDHIDVYLQWADLKEKDMYEVKTDNNGNIVRNRQGNVVYDRNKPKNPPTFMQNLKFLFKYQIGHMYFRYFMWNFAGRQNNVQGHGSYLEGNWISGIPFVDRFNVGKQKNLPDNMKNDPSRNTYFLLPLLLGIFGLFYHLQKDIKNFSVILLLFIMTGIAIVVYLNQPPLQPRERDYAYAGSFYAFAIWIGLGVLGIIELFKRNFNVYIINIPIVAICLLLVPGIMASENWDDHDRSNRYTARDIAYNYLNTCAPNAILFTNGDNDTFPLWYAQEVEGIRPDVRIVNLMLLNMDWYISQMKLKAYDSEPLPISFNFDEYMMGKRDIVYISNKTGEAVDIKRIIEFVKSDHPKTKLRYDSGYEYDFIPIKNFRLPVDSAKVVSNGTVRPEDADKLVSPIDWVFNEGYIRKNALIVLDILANNKWERPIYFVSTGHSTLLGLEDYLQLEGFAYRLVPIKTPTEDNFTRGRIDPEIMYDNMMNKYKWGNMNHPDVFIDNYNIYTFFLLRLRYRFSRLAYEYIQRNDLKKAIEILDRCVELTPHEKIPHDMFSSAIIESYCKCGAFEKAAKLVRENIRLCDEKLTYYFEQNRDFIRNANNEIRRNMQILRNLLIICQTYGLDELVQELEVIYNGHYQSFTRRIY